MVRDTDDGFKGNETKEETIALIMDDRKTGVVTLTIKGQCLVVPKNVLLCSHEEGGLGIKPMPGYNKEKYLQFAEDLGKIHEINFNGFVCTGVLVHNKPSTVKQRINKFLKRGGDCE